MDMTETGALQSVFIPPHKASMTITHNEHLDVYETVAQRIEGADYFGDEDFVSPEDRQRCIDTNELWTCHWYPETPVGFHKLHASSLAALSAAMQAMYAPA
jgi:hypothetical protein